MPAILVYPAHHQFFSTYLDPDTRIVTLYETGKMDYQPSETLKVPTVIVSELFLGLISKVCNSYVQTRNMSGTQPNGGGQGPHSPPKLPPRPPPPPPPPPPPLEGTLRFSDIPLMDLEATIYDRTTLLAYLTIKSDRPDPEAFYTMVQIFLSENGSVVDQRDVTLSPDFSRSTGNFNPNPNPRLTLTQALTLTLAPVGAEQLTRRI